MQNKLKIISFIFIISAFSIIVNGQNLINSPYSRFNLGTLDNVGSFRSLGMGGVGTAIRDNSNIYFTNPASYSSIDTNSFIFDFGISYAIDKLSDGVSDYTSKDMNFDHLLMGFPITKEFGVALGFVPMSNGYYDMGETVSNPVLGNYITSHSGTGGFNTFFLGTGLNLTKNFSVGVNLNMLLGKINRYNQTTFSDDYYNVFHNSTSEVLSLSGVNIDYGLQYTAKLKNDYFFNAGVSFSSNKHYKSNFSHLSYTYNAYGTRDTISSIANDTTKTFIPGTLRLGIAFGKPNKFTAGIDFVSTKWSKAKIPGSSGYAADTRTLQFGLEYIPDAFSNYNYLKRVEYRLGGHIGDNYLILNGEQVKEIGATFGIGLRLRHGYSKTNLYFDFTKKTGSALNNLHTENYYTMGISLNLFDKSWFIKRKYY